MTDRGAARARLLAVHAGWALLLTGSLLVGRWSRHEGSELAVVWPAAAVTVVWLLRTRPGASRAAVSALTGGVVVAVNALTGVEAVASVLFGAVNVVHGWTGLLVLLRRDWPRTGFLPRTQDAVTLLLASIAAATASGLLGGLLAAWRFGADPVVGTATVVARNALSTAVLGAALLALPQLRADLRAWRLPRGDLPAMVAVAATAHLLAFAAVAEGHPVAFLLAPVWVWIGARVSPAVAALLVAAMAVPTVAATRVGGGVFESQSSVHERVLLVQAFLAVSAVVALGLAVTSAERRAATAEARRRTDQLEAYLDTSLVGFAVLDVATGTLTSANPALCRLLERQRGELVGTRWQDHVTAAGAPALLAALSPLRDGTATAWQAELEHCTARGRLRTTQVALAVVPDGAGTVATVQFLDVTERRAAERQLAHRVLHDELTGLPNRTLLRDRLAVALAQRPSGGPRGDREVAVLFFDLDHFKTVNDTYGHDVGDRLLVDTARRMSLALRPQDTVARVGGDEFVALCTGVAGTAEATAIAHRVLDAVHRPLLLDDRSLHVRVSVGVAVAGRDDTAATMLQQADAAMLSAKQQGRGRVERYDLLVPRPRGRETSPAA